MAITFDLDLTPVERTQLAGILRCEPAQLDERFTNYAVAAAQEYARMFLGQRVFTRGADIVEYRLLLLIRMAFNNQIPDEQSVCDLFQTTSTQSRALIRSVMSKYQYELNDARSASLRAAVASVKLINADLLLELSSGSVNIVEALNQTIASINALLPHIEKRRGISAYEVQPNSYRRLCEKFNLEPVAGTPDA